MGTQRGQINSVKPMKASLRMARNVATAYVSSQMDLNMKDSGRTTSNMGMQRGQPNSGWPMKANGKKANAKNG